MALALLQLVVVNSIMFAALTVILLVRLLLTLLFFVLLVVFVFLVGQLGGRLSKKRHQGAVR